jgi:Ca2+-binding RTX toxin-like protein
MGLTNIRRFAVFIAVALCGLAYAGSAAAATTSPFGCRASLARVGLGGSTLAEPLVANSANTPCATETKGVNTVNVPSAANQFINGGPAAVFTFSSTSQSSPAGPVAPGAASLASVDGVTIPTSSGNIVLVGPAYAQVSYACVNGKLTSESKTTLNALEINGNRLALVPDQGMTIQLGGGAYLAVNEKLQTANSLTARLVDLHIPGLADVVVGEATVSYTGDPCAGTNGQTPPGTTACPAGSTYDPVMQVCEIVLSNGQVIVIGPPFTGPYGGTVIALSEAQKLYKSACLSGPGPQYAVVGTNGPDRIDGTQRPERILGLGGNDRIAGQGGDDCIDGGSGNDLIWGGNGNIRTYGGTGTDRIWDGNGTDVVSGGAGNDRIFIGNGSDRVHGNAGNDRISVGRGNDHVYGDSGNNTLSAGNGNDWIFGGSGTAKIYVGNGKSHVVGGKQGGRIYAPDVHMFVKCMSRKTLALLTKFERGYAKHHGCTRIKTIRVKKVK